MHPLQVSVGLKTKAFWFGLRQVLHPWSHYTMKTSPSLLGEYIKWMIFSGVFDSDNELEGLGNTLNSIGSNSASCVS